jgi:hypothetical protein
MNDFATLELVLRRNTLLAATSCLALLAMALASLAYAFTAAGNARELRLRMPVLVVPGAIGGVYSAGLTEENVRATARYLSLLATNFNGATGLRERFDELETFASPHFLPGLQRARLELQRDVVTQNQSRTFFSSPETERMQETESGHFEYTVAGDRIVYASGLPMDTRRSELHLLLHWGAPSQRNRAGIVLDAFDVHDATAPAKTAVASTQP